MPGEGGRDCNGSCSVDRIKEHKMMEGLKVGMHRGEMRGWEIDIWTDKVGQQSGKR